MLDIVKALLDALKLVPISDLAARHREEKIAAIGLKLLDLYNLATQITNSGYVIVKSLDHLVRRHRYFYESHDHDSTIKAAFRMRPLLARQMSCIGEFLQLANELKDFANIVDRSSVGDFQTMRNVAWRKRVMYGFGYLQNSNGDDFRIDFKSERVGMGKIFGYISAELNRWNDIASKPNLDPDKDEVEFAEIEDLEAHFSRLLETMGGEANSIPWNEDTTNVIERFIASGLPKKRLDLMAQAAASFRESIYAQFETDELLLAAEKRKLRDS